ncbi:MAG: hypothetical protein ABIZ49_07620 [Opitutaceae bacterium]
MKSRLRMLAMVVGGLALAGLVAEPLAAPVWAAMRAKEPALKLDTTTAAAAQGATLALLGGFRALVADAGWLQVYASWEKRDLAATEASIRLVTAVDPRPVYFWLNGARMIAYDFPVWRIEAAGGYEAVTEERQWQISREQGARALAQLEQARQFHPASVDLWIERANIELNRLRDVAAAAESYRHAAEQPHAPYYVARLHAEMLRRMGRNREALAWLVKLHPSLPRDDESARADVVLERIHELERQLEVAPDNAYRPPPAASGREGESGR